jgi:hypothetical protein
VRVLGFDYATCTLEGPPTDNNGFGEAVDGGRRGGVAGRTSLGGAREKVDGSAGPERLSGLTARCCTCARQCSYKRSGRRRPATERATACRTSRCHDQTTRRAHRSTATWVYSGADNAPLHTVPRPSARPETPSEPAGDLNATAPDLLMLTDQYSTPLQLTVTALRRCGAFTDLASRCRGACGTPHCRSRVPCTRGCPAAVGHAAPLLAPLFLVLGQRGCAGPLPRRRARAGAADRRAPRTRPALDGRRQESCPPSGTQLVVQGWLPDAPAPTHAATNAVWRRALISRPRPRASPSFLTISSHHSPPSPAATRPTRAKLKNWPCRTGGGRCTGTGTTR